MATPYTKYGKGITVAFEVASIIAARMLKAGHRVYSPIAHTHPLAIYGELDPLDHSIWLPFDEAMMQAADGLIVAQMQGWQDSFGVKHEIEFFTKAGKPVLYLDCESLALKEQPWGQS